MRQDVESAVYFCMLDDGRGKASCRRTRFELRRLRGRPGELEPVGTEDRLGDVSGGTAFGGAWRVLRFLVGGNKKDDGQLVAAVEDLPRRVEAVDPRHVHVHQ